MSIYPDNCPACESNFEGEPIPTDVLEHYGGATHYLRIIGIYSIEEDRTVAWRCPDCGHEWDRDNHPGSGTR